MAEPSTAPAKAMAVLALLPLLLASVHAASPCICSSVAEASSAVCGSDAVSYSSACELKCAMAVNKGLTMAHKGLCKNVDSHKETNPISTNTQTGRLVSLSPLDQFGRCNIDCVDTFKKCESDCQSTDCVEQCVYNQLVNCNCGCLKLLSASQRLLSYVKDIKELPDLSFEKSLLLREGRSMQDAQQTVDCYNTEMATMLKCSEPCAPAQDEACAIKCVRPAFERICNCKPQAAISSTSRPTAGPTRPSSQAPGPTFQTTTRPGAWTTSRPSGVTTRKPNSGSSFRSHYAVITLSFVILSVFRL